MQWPPMKPVPPVTRTSFFSSDAGILILWFSRYHGGEIFFQFLLDIGDDFGMTGGDIETFAGVVFQIEQQRRRVRLRITALPIFFVTVKPRRAGPVSSRGSAWSTSPGMGALRPLAAARWNSARRVRRPGAAKQGLGSGRQPLATLGPAVGQHLAASDRGHPGAESMPPLADELRRLIGALHSQYSDSAWVPTRAPAHRRRLIGGRSWAVNRGALAG